MFLNTQTVYMCLRNGGISCWQLPLPGSGYCTLWKLMSALLFIITIIIIIFVNDD